MHDLSESRDEGEPRLVIIQIVLAQGAGDLSATPSLTEGPYYPVVGFHHYDNDLLDANPEQEPLTLLDLPPAGDAFAVEFTLLNLNRASDDELRTLVDVGPNPMSERRLLREFDEYRPYISSAQFRREIGKYVSEEQVAAYEAHIYVPIDFSASDAATLQQIPGLSAELAETLIEARPFADRATFLAALAADGSLMSEQLTLAEHYLAE